MVYEQVQNKTRDSTLTSFSIDIIIQFLPRTEYYSLIRQSHLCRFCCKETESIDHLFWYCTYAACFWSQVQEWLKENHNMQLKWTLQIAVLGNVESHSQSKNNIMILAVKVFIFSSQSVDTIRFERLKTFCKTSQHNWKIYGSLKSTKGGLRW